MQILTHYFGRACYWSDVPTNPQQVANEECDMTCAGGPSQWCGGPNRLIGYQHINWFDPSRAQPAKAMGWYLDVLGRLQVTVKDWLNLLEQLRDEQVNGMKLRRQVTPLMQATNAVRSLIKSTVDKLGMMYP